MVATDVVSTSQTVPENKTDTQVMAILIFKLFFRKTDADMSDTRKERLSCTAL